MLSVLVNHLPIGEGTTVHGGEKGEDTMVDQGTVTTEDIDGVKGLDHPFTDPGLLGTCLSVSSVFI